MRSGQRAGRCNNCYPSYKLPFCIIKCIVPFCVICHVQQRRPPHTNVASVAVGSQLVAIRSTSVKYAGHLTADVLSCYDFSACSDAPSVNPARCVRHYLAQLREVIDAPRQCSACACMQKFEKSSADRPVQGVDDGANCNLRAQRAQVSPLEKSDDSDSHHHQAEEHSGTPLRIIDMPIIESPTLIRISIDMLSGKTLAAEIDPLVSVLDLKYRLHVRPFAVLV